MGVKEAHRIASPYKLASRNFNPGGTVVKIGGVAIGGEQVVVMAGPCSVESREQIDTHRGAGGAGRRARDSRRRVQAAQLAVQLPGHGRGRPADAATRRPTATACWW